MKLYRGDENLILEHFRGVSDSEDEEFEPTRRSKRHVHEPPREDDTAVHAHVQNVSSDAPYEPLAMPITVQYGDAVGKKVNASAAVEAIQTFGFTGQLARLQSPSDSELLFTGADLANIGRLRCYSLRWGLADQNLVLQSTGLKPSLPGPLLHVSTGDDYLYCASQSTVLVSHPRGRRRKRALNTEDTPAWPEYRELARRTSEKRLRGLRVSPHDVGECATLEGSDEICVWSLEGSATQRRHVPLPHMAANRDLALHALDWWHHPQVIVAASSCLHVVDLRERGTTTQIQARRLDCIPFAGDITALEGHPLNEHCYAATASNPLQAFAFDMRMFPRLLHQWLLPGVSSTHELEAGGYCSLSWGVSLADTSADERHETCYLAAPYLGGLHVGLLSLQQRPKVMTSDNDVADEFTIFPGDFLPYEPPGCIVGCFLESMPLSSSSSRRAAANGAEAEPYDDLVLVSLKSTGSVSAHTVGHRKRPRKTSSINASVAPLTNFEFRLWLTNWLEGLDVRAVSVGTMRTAFEEQFGALDDARWAELKHVAGEIIWTKLGTPSVDEHQAASAGHSEVDAVKWLTGKPEEVMKVLEAFGLARREEEEKAHVPPVEFDERDLVLLLGAEDSGAVVEAGAEPSTEAAAREEPEQNTEATLVGSVQSTEPTAPSEPKRPEIGELRSVLDSLSVVVPDRWRLCRIAVPEQRISIMYLATTAVGSHVVTDDILEGVRALARALANAGLIRYVPTFSSLLRNQSLSADFEGYLPQPVPREAVRGAVVESQPASSSGTASAVVLPAVSDAEKAQFWADIEAGIESDPTKPVTIPAPPQLGSREQRVSDAPRDGAHP